MRANGSKTVAYRRWLLIVCAVQNIPPVVPLQSRTAVTREIMRFISLIGLRFLTIVKLESLNPLLAFYLFLDRSDASQTKLCDVIGQGFDIFHHRVLSRGQQS